MSTAPARQSRIRAAPLVGRRWLNTGGRPLDLAGLRGKFVLLDFWTFCCINCLHVLDELRSLQEKYADVLVVIGVHSPKFAHEADADALAAAVERYEVDHPVLDDADLATWQAYAARAWPTLTLIDPTGYVVAQMSGEGHAAGLEIMVNDLVTEHERAGTLRRGDGPYVAADPPPTALRFPGKAILLAGGTVLVTDTAHHQVVELEDDLATERRRIGSGRRALSDGGSAVAAFSEPQGLLALPAPIAASVGYDIVVADTVNHALRGLRLADGSVRTVAGTGVQLRERSGAGPALGQPLSSPWDLAWFGDAVIVAMAGTHQLWRFDPRAGTIGVLAGTSAEGLRDGPGDIAHFAQPSGLATAEDGRSLWIVDAETSALRHLSGESASGPTVRTDVGAGLFEFGHVDGSATEARMQHPLGVATLPDGSVAVCDTYNGALRRFDPDSGEMSTLATGLVEPSDAMVETDSYGARLIVVESGAHRLVRVSMPPTAQRVRGAAQHAHRPATQVAPGDLQVDVSFVPPAGQQLDRRYGDPTRLDISASPPSLLESGAGAAAGLSRVLRVAESVAGGVLHISVQAAACDGHPETGEVPEHAACHLYQQDWGIPVVVDRAGENCLVLPLRATIAQPAP